MHLVKRIKKAWELSNSEEVKAAVIAEEDLGDGKAEFLGEGTEAEFVEQQRIDNGEDKWYKRIFRDE